MSNSFLNDNGSNRAPSTPKSLLQDFDFVRSSLLAPHSLSAEIEVSKIGPVQIRYVTCRQGLGIPLNPINDARLLTEPRIHASETTSLDEPLAQRTGRVITVYGVRNENQRRVLAPLPSY